MARGSWRSRWPAATRIRSSTRPSAASASARASSMGTTSSDAPWTISIGRGGILPMRPSGRISRSSRAHASKSGGKAGSLMTPTERAWARNRRGSAAHSPKSAGARKGGHPLHPPSSPAAHRREGPADREPAHPDRLDALHGQQVVDRRLEVGQPAADEKSPSDAPVPRKLKVNTTQPASSRQPVRQLRVGLPGDRRPAALGREAVAHDQSVAPEPLGGRRSTAGPGSRPASGRSNRWCALRPRHGTGTPQWPALRRPRSAGPVAPVAGLGQQVGPEGGELLRRPAARRAGTRAGCCRGRGPAGSACPPATGCARSVRSVGCHGRGHGYPAQVRGRRGAPPRIDHCWKGRRLRFLPGGTTLPAGAPPG